MKLNHYILALVFLCSLYSLGQESDLLFNKGKEFYATENYTAAIEQWEKVIANGKHSTSLYYNLGNAHYKLNNIGPSIYYYEKALQLSPNDSEVKNNLAFAKNATVDAIEPLPKTFFKKVYEKLYSIATYDTWAWITVFLSVFVVVTFLLYYYTVTTQKKRSFFIMSLTGLLALFLCLAMAYSTYNNVITTQTAIIFDESIDIKKEAQLGSTTSFVLHEGTKVAIIDTTENWSKIRISNGEEGWIPTTSIKKL